MTATTVTAGDNLEVLQGNDQMKGEGSWVFTHQGVAAEQGFRNVSQHWYKKTMSYEDGLKQLAEGRVKTQDILATVEEMVPAVDEQGRFVLKYTDGRLFRPTLYAIGQMGGWAETGRWFAESLYGNPKDGKGNERFARDREDGETLVRAFNNGFRRIDPEKQFLWRTREDGTVRAMLSTQYARVDNEWFIEALRKLIPGGRLSHWRGDADTIFGNVLVPDTIRADKDSDYGGMLSIGNSEIGERRIMSLPSIFRAICMNGCIWGQKVGKGIKQVHRGRINLDELFVSLKTNLEAQIPLLPTGIDKLLGVRKFAWDGASVLPLFAQVSLDHRLSKRQASSLLAGYNEERAVAPEYARTLFSVVNAVTRAGQKLENAGWVKFDEIGGRLASYDEKDWERLSGRAKSLKAEQVGAAFALAV